MAAEPTEKEVTKYFVKEKRMLKLFGLSLSGDESLFYKIYSYTIFYSMNFAHPTMQLTLLFSYDFEVVSDMMIYILFSYLSCVRTVVVMKNRTRFAELLKRLEKEPFKVNLERGGVKEANLNKECLWFTHNQTVIYWTIGFTTIYANIIFAIIRRLTSNDYRDWVMPFGPLRFTNATYSPSYDIGLIYQCIAGTSIGAHLFTIDLLTSALLAHMSYQFKMLQNNIKRITLNCYTEMQKEKAGPLQSASSRSEVANETIDASEIPWKYLHKHLKETVQYHLEVAKLAEDMEKLLSNFLLTIFLGVLAVLCFSVYRTSMVVGNTVKVIIDMFDVFTACLQVAAVCYWGELVVHESQEVGRAVFQSNFVGADLRFQKGLALIIRRSQNPTKLTAGRFTNVHLPTFAWIVRAAYSSFMVLKSSTSNEVITTTK